MNFRLTPEMSRRQMIQGAAVLALASQLPGCTSTVQPLSVAGLSVNPQPAPSGPSTTATLSVSTTAAGVIPAGFVGLSYEKSNLYQPLFSASNANLISLFRALGTSVLRIGGDSVDVTVWAPNGPGQTTGQVAPKDVDAFAGFVKATGWTCIYGVNLGGSASGQQTPALAAAEVAYAVKALGSSFGGVELGNEPDNWSQSFYAPAGLTAAQYFTLWTTYRNAILAVTPGVQFVGPAAAALPGPFTVPFAQLATKSELSLITQHYYRADGSLPTSTAAVLLSPDTRLTGYILPTVQAGSQSLGIPYRLGECNSYYDGGASMVSNAYASSLWVLDFLFDVAQFQCAGCNFQTGSPSHYSAITNAGAAITSVNPLYYGLSFFNLVGTGTMVQTTLMAGGLNVNAYAVMSPTGGINLIVSNKDSTQNLNLAITLPQTANRALLGVMTQLSAGATAPNIAGLSGVTIQGGTIGLDSTFEPNALYTLTAATKQLNCYVPALSAIVILIT